VHEGGDGERRHRKPRPDPGAGQVAALGEPCQRNRQDDGNRHGQQHQQDGVDQELANARPKDQRRHGFPAGLHGNPDDEGEGQQRKQRDEGGDDRNPRQRPAMSARCCQRQA